jgi:L-ascorbate metabolism protein UlaG (beta-lactamase superfamily)
MRWRSWRRWAYGALLLLLLAPMAFLAIGCAFDGPAYRGPVSGHFDGTVFRNPEPVPDKTLWDVMAWRASSTAARETPVVSVVPAVPARRVDGDRLVATWVGHATVLLQGGGLNVLTDPVWADRASPVAFAGPKRYAAPGIRFADLPPIDLVLVTHNHYDHCDLDTLARLHREHGARIVVPLGVDLLLAERGIPSAAVLDWWDATTLAGATVAAVPARHFSARGISDRNRTLWCGYVLDLPGAGRVYMAGDTGMGAHFAEVGARYPGSRLALLPVGAHLPRYFMAAVHTDPAEAVAALGAVGAQAGLGIHWNTFPMADDGPADTRRELEAALAARGPGAPLRLLAHGEAWDLGPADPRIPGPASAAVIIPP